MSNIKNGGIFYIRKKTPKFQTGNAFTAEETKPIGYNFGDANLFGKSGNGSFSMSAPKNPMAGYAKAASANFNTRVANQLPIAPEGVTAGFGANKYQGAFGKSSAAANFGNKAAATSIASPMEGVKIKPAGGGFSAAAGAGAVGAAAGMLGAAIGKGDGDATTFTKKEKKGVLMSSTLKGISVGASIGSVVPGLGTVIGAGVGAVAGVITGLFKSKKMKKEAGTALIEQNRTLESAAAAKRRSEIASRDASLALSMQTTGRTQDATLSGYLSRKNGGSFHYTLKPSLSENRLKVLNTAPPKKLKRGGSITATENIIPNGVLHEEFNKLGDKGMPVVKCKNNSCEKKYEIERDEMIFTLAATKNVEKLVKAGDLKKLGEYVRSQVLDNTHSFTDKFNDLNNYNKNKDESIFA